jgi:hypothetical protein
MSVCLSDCTFYARSCCTDSLKFSVDSVCVCVCVCARARENYRGVNVAYCGSSITHNEVRLCQFSQK